MSNVNPAPSKNPLLQTLITMVGQSNVITIHRPLVDFLGGSLEGAMLLSQLLYWTPRSVMGGWIAKSDLELQNELCLKRYSVRAAREMLEEKGVIESKLQKFNGFPTQHYRVRLDALEAQWRAFLRLSENEQTDCAKTDDGLSENEQSLTETTNRESLVVVVVSAAEIFKKYEQEIGALTPLIADAIHADIKDYSAEWVVEAMQIAVKANKRSWAYVQGILKRCKEKNVRPSLNRLEISHGNNGSGNSKRAKQPRPEKADDPPYTDADRAAAEIVKQRSRQPVPTV